MSRHEIELHQRYFGEGLVGHIDVAPSLSWREREEISSAARNSASAAARAAETADAVARLHDGIEHLESTLGYRLSAQTEVLRAQLDTLDAISDAVRSPAKTRAAERIVAAGELLERGRYARALETAEQAIVDDPNEASAFRAAGWAHMGLGDSARARAAFREEAQAADDADGASGARRRATRLTLAIDGAQAALDELGPLPPGCSPAERAAVGYERAIFLSVLGRSDEACDELMPAVDHDARMCAMAYTDPLLAGTPLADHARKTFTAISAAVNADCDEQLMHLGEVLELFETVLAEYRSAGLTAPGADRGVSVDAWLREGTGAHGAFESRDRVEAGIAEQRERLQPRVSAAATQAARDLGEQARAFVRDQARPHAVTAALGQHLGLVEIAAELLRQHGGTLTVTGDGAWLLNRTLRGGRVIQVTAWIGEDGVTQCAKVDGVPVRSVDKLPAHVRGAVQRHVELVQAGCAMAADHKADAIRMPSADVFAFSKSPMFGPPREWLVRRAADGTFTVGHA